MVISRLVTLASAVVLVVVMHASTRTHVLAQGDRPLSKAQANARGDVEHGRYIVERVVMCFECHSSRDAQGDIIPETRFMGGPIPVRPPWPNDWAIRAPRIAGLPGYTEELGVRLLTQGAIGRSGSALRLPMPRFRMTPQDAADVVAYLKSLP